MRHRLAVLSRALASPRLRRVEAAFFGFGISEYGVWVVVLVFAFRRGGTTAAGVIAAVQLLPASVVAPLAARLIEARGAAAALCAGYVIQAASLAVTAALVLAETPAAIVYVGAVVAACAVTVTRPAQAALLPALVQTPAQLTAANVVSGWVDTVTLLAGPAIASVALGVAGAGWALVVFAGVVTGSALVVAPLRRLGRTGGAEDEDESRGSLREAIRVAPGALPALTMLTAEYAVLGALDVLEVVLAALVLGLGAGGAGFLGAAFGAGGVAGAIGGARPGGTPSAGTAAVAGGDAVGRRLHRRGGMARGRRRPVPAGARRRRSHGPRRGRSYDPAPHGAPDVARARLRHARRGGDVRAGGRVVGRAAAGQHRRPPGAVAVVGGLLVVVPLVTVPELRKIERAAPTLEAEIGLMRRVPLFTMLNAPVLEDLARALRPVQAHGGEVIAREGERGEEYFVVAIGTLDVSIAGRFVTTLGHGDGFGEIALLHEGVRTATVTCTSEVTLYALARAPFLEAVTGSRQAHRAARELVAERLAAPFAERLS